MTRCNIKNCIQWGKVGVVATRGQYTHTCSFRMLSPPATCFASLLISYRKKKGSCFLVLVFLFVCFFQIR